MTTEHAFLMPSLQVQGHPPARGEASGTPVTDDVGLKVEGLSQGADAAGRFDRYFENIHVEDYYTFVSHKDANELSISSNMKTLAERLVSARESKGDLWTRKHLAIASGVSYSNISMLEQGSRGNTGTVPGTIPQIAKALGVRYEWLAHGEEPKLPEGPITQVLKAVAQDEQLRLQMDQVEHILRMIPQDQRLKATFEAMQVLWRHVDAHLAKTGQIAPALSGPQA